MSNKSSGKRKSSAKEINHERLTEERNLGSLKEVISVEKRGIKTYANSVFYGQDGQINLELTLAQAKLNFDPILWYADLRNAANDYLVSRGELSYFDALEKFKVEDPGTPGFEPGAFALTLWLLKISERHGALSKEVAAARFIVLGDKMCMEAKEDEKAQRGIFSFANAWYDWKMELRGEHEVLVRALASDANLEKAGPTRRNKKNERLRIVKLHAEQHWALKSADRRNMGTTAARIIEAVNAALCAAGHKAYTLGTLEKLIATIVKDTSPLNASPVRSGSG